MKLQLAALLAPVDRLREVPAAGWALSALLSAVHFVRSDLFAGALMLLIVAGAIDYFLGRKVALLRQEYRPETAQMGAIGKASGVVLVLMVRLFEWWIGQHLGVDSRGWLSGAVAMSLFAVDLESISHHRESLGAKPIPVLSTLIHKVHERGDALVSGLLGVPRGGGQ